MATVSVNGYGVIEAHIAMPRIGAWHADLVVDSTLVGDLSGPLTISIDQGALTLNGTARRVDVYGDTVSMRVIAGAAGLATPATAKYYQQTPLRIPLADLIANAGEALSGTADATVLATSLNAWTTTTAPVSRNLLALLADSAPTAAWRMLADGTFWTGFESWPQATLEYQLLNKWPHLNKIEIGSQAPVLMPGTSLDGMHISYVAHHVTAESVRSTAWLE